jgi:hypothetical protein
MDSTAVDDTPINKGEAPTTAKKASSRDYKGFVAGVFSGIAKLTGEKSKALLAPVSSNCDMSNFGTHSYPSVNRS